MLSTAFSGRPAAAGAVCGMGGAAWCGGDTGRTAEGVFLRRPMSSGQHDTGKAGSWPCREVGGKGRVAVSNE